MSLIIIYIIDLKSIYEPVGTLKSIYSYIIYCAEHYVHIRTHNIKIIDI